MLLQVIFLQCIGVVLAGYNIHKLLSRFESEYPVAPLYQDVALRRKYKPYEVKEPAVTCDQMAQTPDSGFVVMVLHKSSGRFLGMGGIIDKKTVITATRVVDQSVRAPHTLFIVAGRRSPWWGRYSQVRQAKEIHKHDIGLALIILKKELYYNKNIHPIPLTTGPLPIPDPDFADVYDQQWGIFGIPRTSWDIPGDRISKSSTYLMRAVTFTIKPEDKGSCKGKYPGLEFHEPHMGCSYANYTFCWGCIGSPIVAIDREHRLLMIAVIMRTTLTESDQYHVHVKLGYYEQWIKAHSLEGFKRTWAPQWGPKTFLH